MIMATHTTLRHLPPIIRASTLSFVKHAMAGNTSHAPPVNTAAAFLIDDFYLIILLSFYSMPIIEN